MKNYHKKEFFFKRSSRQIGAKFYTCMLGLLYVLFSIPFVMIIYYVIQNRHFIQGMTIGIVLDIILFIIIIPTFFGGLFVLHGIDHHFTYTQTTPATWLVNKSQKQSSKVKFVTKINRKYLLRRQELTLLSTETELRRNQYLVGAFKIVLGFVIIPFQSYASAKLKMMVPLILGYSLLVVPIAIVLLYESKKEDLYWKLSKNADGTISITWNNNKESVKYIGKIGSLRIIQSTYNKTFQRKRRKRDKEATLQVYNLEIDLSGNENGLNYFIEDRRLLLYSNMLEAETIVFRNVIETWLDW